MIATPIDTTTGEKALLLARMDGYFLASVLQDIVVGETGFAFLVNEEGTIQAHPDQTFISEQKNFLVEAEESGNKIGEATAIEKLITNDQGFFEFKHSDGDNRFLGYYTLENGWSMGIMAKEKEMFISLMTMKIILIISTFSVLFIGFMEEMSASVTSAAVYVKEVAHSAAGQLQTVDEMAIQAERLSDMAKELQVAIQQFKL